MITDFIDHVWYTIKYYEMFSWGALIFFGIMYQAIDYAVWRKHYIPKFSHKEVECHERL